MFDKLTIITITYNNEIELLKTYKSTEVLRKNGANHVIINGGKPLSKKLNNCIIIEEPDEGLYDALNKGIKHVKSEYFILVHSGDEFIPQSCEKMRQILNYSLKNNIDLILNSCLINYKNIKRKYNVRNWRPWMLKFGIQPPHPPIIYRYNAVENILYNKEIATIADFKYIETLFKLNLQIFNSAYYLIELSSGGKTTSGIKSYFHVTKEFIRHEGIIKGLLFMVGRLIGKLFLSI